jgi:hypothetical protein
MRRRNMFRPGVECVERRLSLSAAGASTSAVSAAHEASVQRLELENTLVSNISAPTQRPGGSQQIIAILIG